MKRYITHLIDIRVLSGEELSQTSIQFQNLSESPEYVWSRVWHLYIKLQNLVASCVCVCVEVYSQCKGSPVRWWSAGPSSAYPEQSSPSARSPTENSHICCWMPALSETGSAAKTQIKRLRTQRHPLTHTELLKTQTYAEKKNAWNVIMA